MSSGTARVERLALTLLGVVAALIGLSGIGSWDLWWHMATGRLALEQGSTLPFDPFSLTQAGAPWVYKDLGADVLLYAVYDAFGGPGLAALKLVLALGLTALLVILVRRRVRAVWALLALCGGALMVASFRVIMRPESFTLVALTGLLVLLGAWRRREAPRAPWLAVGIVALMWLWANLHRGVVLGAAVLVGYTVYELASALERRSSRPGRWLPSVVTPAERPAREASKTALLALVASGVTLLNPSGLALWSQAVEVGTSETLANAVSEWEVLSIGAMWNHFPVAVVWMAAVAIVLPIAWWRSAARGAGVDLWDVALAALGLLLGLSAVRLLPVMALLTVGPMAGSLAALGADAERGSGQPTSRAELLATALAALALVALVWLDPRVAKTAPGLRGDWFPDEAVTLMAQAPVAGQGYTTYRFAGYVLFHLWPDKRVLCDGRFDTVYDDTVIETCLAAERNPEVFADLVERYELQWVLDHNRPEARPGFAWLDADPAWALVHWDAASLLYVRRDGPNPDLARARAFGVLEPHDLVMSLRRGLDAARGDPPRRALLDAEVRRLQEAAPDDYRTFVVLALYLHTIGATQTDEYRLVVEGLRARRDDDPSAIDQVLRWIGEE